MSVLTSSISSMTDKTNFDYMTEKYKKIGLIGLIFEINAIEVTDFSLLHL